MLRIILKQFCDSQIVRIELNNEILDAKGENVAHKGKGQMLEEQHHKDQKQIEHLQQELTRITSDRDSMKIDLVALQTEAEQ